MDECVITNGELYHHGVKGMKWGVRRYQNKDGTLTDRGIKRYAKKGYAQDSLKSNKTVAGKAWDRYTGAHKIQAGVKYDTSSDKKNKARAEQYLADKEAKKQKAIKNVNKSANKEKVARAVAKGASITSKVAVMSIADDIFYKGAGKKIVGRAIVTAYVKARGGHNIRWYDT